MKRLILFVLSIVCFIQTIHISAQLPCKARRKDNFYITSKAGSYSNSSNDFPCKCDTLNYLEFDDTSVINNCLEGKYIIELGVGSYYPIDSLPAIVQTMHTIDSLSLNSYIKINKTLLSQNTVRKYFHYFDIKSKRIDERLGLFRRVKHIEIYTPSARYIDFNMFSFCDSLEELTIYSRERTLKIDKAFILPKRLKKLTVNWIGLNLSEELVTCLANSNIEELSIRLNPRRKIPKNISELCKIKNVSINIGMMKVSARRYIRQTKKLKAYQCHNHTD